MRRAFTLIEVLISITLFSMILLALYQVLNVTKVSNAFFDKKVSKQAKLNDIKAVLIEDVIESEGNILLSSDKESNTILQFKSSNTYHHKQYNNITYMVSKEKNLLRIESRQPLNKNQDLTISLNDAYVDLIIKSMEKFIVIQNSEVKHVYTIVIKQKNRKEQIVSALTVRTLSPPTNGVSK